MKQQVLYVFLSFFCFGRGGACLHFSSNAFCACGQCICGWSWRRFRVAAAVIMMMVSFFFCPPSSLLPARLAFLPFSISAAHLSLSPLRNSCSNWYSSRKKSDYVFVTAYFFLYQRSEQKRKEGKGEEQPQMHPLFESEAIYTQDSSSTNCMVYRLDERGKVVERAKINFSFVTRLLFFLFILP